MALGVDLDLDECFFELESCAYLDECDDIFLLVSVSVSVLGSESEKLVGGLSLGDVEGEATGVVVECMSGSFGSFEVMYVSCDLFPTSV